MPLGVRNSRFALRAASINKVRLPPAPEDKQNAPRGPSCFFGVHIPQRSAAVCTGASHSASVSASAAVTVIEQPAISSEVT